MFMSSANKILYTSLDCKATDHYKGMDELGVEVGVKESFKKKMVRSGLKWVGHVGRMGDEKGRETGEEDREHENCIKRDLERVGGEWRTTVTEREVGDC